MNRTVFLAFFLVLVFWPVYSHGRAYETESVVFNNTQHPYKGTIDAEPVTLPMQTYDHVFLTLVWRNSFCESHSYPCGHQGLPLTVLHGMWPQKTGHLPIDCTGAGRAGTYSELGLQRVRHGELVNHLNSFWLNIDPRPHIDVWEQEYVKHGSCFFPTQVEYFESTVVMMRQIPDLSVKLYGAGVRPGRIYTFVNLLRRISGVYGYRPRLQCRYYARDRIPSLYQIFFCATTSNYLVNCDDLNVPLDDNCRNGPVKLR